MRVNSNQKAFLTLVKLGLWGSRNPDEWIDETIDWDFVYQLAQEQSVQGLALQGVEAVQNTWKKEGSPLMPKTMLLQWIGDVQIIEQKNRSMNAFIAELINRLREDDIYAILVKGQGVAQCYEKPLWRVCGDVDLLLSPDNFEKAYSILVSYSCKTKRDTLKNIERKHKEYQIGGWTVELHGTMHANLSRKIDLVIDRVQQDVFCGEKVRSVEFKSSGGSKIQVFLPAPDEDVLFVFTHILQHLFLEGIGLRQICDWCRLLWTYKDSLNYRLLESRINTMGLVSEWKAFYNLANRYLGMPDLGGRLMVRDSKYDKKTDRLMAFVLKVGNFGHNRDVEWANPIKRRTSLIRHRITDTVKLSFIFPLDAPRFLLNYAVDGVRGLVRR